MSFITLNNKRLMPALGLGTWKSDHGSAEAAVKTAIEKGYRHIDAAMIYDNEAEVGRGIAACIASEIVRRDELFITSKLWNSDHAPSAVSAALTASLKRLGLDYLDLYLMHWPIAQRPGVVFPESPADFIPLAELPLAATWKAMEGLVDESQTRAIGVSNFSVGKLKALLPHCAVVPAVNQVEIHPFNAQSELVDYCVAQGIHVTAYSPLGSGDRPDALKQVDEPSLLGHPVVAQIAKRLDRTPAQVLLAWALTRGLSVIPKSTHAGRIAENHAAGSLHLEAHDMDALNGLERGFRYVDPGFFKVPGITFEGEDFWD